MKKLVFALAIAGLTFTSCGEEGESGGDTAEPTIEGTWRLDAVSGEELTDTEKEMRMTLNTDGTCSQGAPDDEPRTGNWTLSEDGKTLNCVFGDRDASFTEVTFDATNLSFMDGGDKISFVRE